jgi:hypothetical protein
MSIDGSIHSVLLDSPAQAALTGGQMSLRMGLIHFFLDTVQLCSRVPQAR